MSIQRARSVEEYVDFVQQALYELEELRVAAEYNLEDLGTSLGFVNELEAGVRQLYRSMEEGSYRFENKDLPFMDIVERYDTDALPFRHLLRQINETHRLGLDAE